MIKLSVIIPCFNQADTVIKIIKSLDSIPKIIEKEIILVDDGSSNDCKIFLRNRLVDKVTVLAFHKTRSGRIAVLRTGLSQATGEIILLLDFGTIYQSEDYLNLIKPIIDCNAEVVWVPYAYKTNSSPVGSYRTFLWNRFLTGFSNFLCNLNLSHFRAGGILFHKKFFCKVTIKDEKSILEPQLLSLMAESKSRIFEVNPHHKNLPASLSKKEAINAFYSMVKHNLFW